MPPIGEIEERNLPSGGTSPASQSQMSGSSPAISRPSTSFESFRSSMAPEVSALFRLLTEHSIDFPEIESGDDLSERLPGYQRISFPREQTLLDLLHQSSGEKDVHLLKEVRLRVVASSISLSRLGSYCPRIRILRLDGSGLTSLREIGTTLKYLKVLHVARCGLTSLDGTFGLTSLQELHAMDNHIQNVGPCTALENIKTINLDGNPINCRRNVGMLSLCSRLTRLSLIDTPLSQEADYLSWIIDALPNLQQVDGKSIRDDVDDGESESESISCSFDLSSMTEPNSDDYVKTPDHSDISNCMDYSSPSNKYSLEDPSIMQEATKEHVYGGPQKPRTPERSAQTKRPETANGVPSHYSSSGRPSSSSRPRSAQPRPSISSFAESVPIFPEVTHDATPSLLTSGVVVCGNIGRALARARCAARRLRTTDDTTLTSETENTRKESLILENDKTNTEMEILQDNNTHGLKYHQSLHSARKMLEEPLPEKPKESTPFVELEFGVTGAIHEPPWESCSDEVMQRTSQNALKASRMWRKAFKMYRRQQEFPPPNDTTDEPPNEKDKDKQTDISETEGI